MLNILVRFWFYPMTVALAFCAPVSPAYAGQGVPGIFGVFGGMLNSAIRDSARRDWQNRPVSDYNCLASQNVSVDQLAARGIGPNDPRVGRILEQCAQATPATPAPVVARPTDAPIGPYNPDFVIDGLALGGTLYPDSPVYKAYACQPSDQFSGFTWCTIKHPMTGKFGPYNSWVTILHSPENAAIFITQVVTPAFFGRGDVEHEIQRLSQRFGQAARILNGDPRPDAAHSIIAVWGDLSLTPLDESTMDALRSGNTITAGLVADFLGDVNKSARENLPVFRIGGGAGFIWGARFDNNGKGIVAD